MHPDACYKPVESGCQAALHDILHVRGCKEFGGVGYVLENHQTTDAHRPRGGLTLLNRNMDAMWNLIASVVR